eukprot:3275565-Karenia_brevis.AAC.1
MFREFILVIMLVDTDINSKSYGARLTTSIDQFSVLLVSTTYFQLMWSLQLQSRAFNNFLPEMRKRDIVQGTITGRR